MCVIFYPPRYPHMQSSRQINVSEQGNRHPQVNDGQINERIFTPESITGVLE